MSEKIIMPKELTAENGAKSLFMGEFKEEEELTCISCDEDGNNFDGDVCDICLGGGSYTQKTTISWTTIKDIYKMAVKNFGENIS